MQIDLPLEIFTYPDVPLPEVWTVEQANSTPALTYHAVAAQAIEAAQILLAARTLPAGASVPTSL